jgi:hypothetical protein
MNCSKNQINKCVSQSLREKFPKAKFTDNTSLSDDDLFGPGADSASVYTAVLACAKSVECAPTDFDSYFHNVTTVVKLKLFLYDWCIHRQSTLKVENTWGD